VCLEALDDIILALNLLDLFVTQSIFGGLKPLAKIFDTGGVLLSFLSHLLAGFELSFQVIGAFFGMM
jgi:hypothetical protein